MTNQLFWCRHISLKIGNNDDPNNAFEITTEDQETEFRVDFTIYKTRTSSPNKSIVQVFNLSSDFRSRADSEYDRITLEAGYNHENSQFYGVLLDGWIVKVRHFYNGGGDIVSEFTCVEGGVSARNSRFARTYEGGVGYESIVRDIVGSMTNVTLGYITPAIKQSIITERRGRTFATTGKIALDEIARQHDARWTIDNNVLDIVSNNEAIQDGQVVPEISSTSGLIGKPSVTEKGVDVDCLIIPDLKPNMLIRIVDDLISTGRNGRELNDNRTGTDEGGGIYRINQVVFSGTNRGNEFRASLKCQSTENYRVIRPPLDLDSRISV